MKANKPDKKIMSKNPKPEPATLNSSENYRRQKTGDCLCLRGKKWRKPTSLWISSSKIPFQVLLSPRKSKTFCPFFILPQIFCTSDEIA